MLTLYFRPSCPFCVRVLRAIDTLNIEVEMKDTATNTIFRDELVTLGGKTQVPFLVDSTNDINMYESADIIKYLEKQVSLEPETTKAIPRIHKAGPVCD